MGGYWAIQDLNYNGRGTFGNRILSSAPQPGNAATPSVQYVDPSTSFDGMSLWQLPDGTGNNIPALLNSGGVGLWSLYFAQMYVVTSCGYYCGSAYTPPPGIQIQDQGNYQFQFNIHPGVGFYTGQAAVSNNGPLELQGTFASNHGDEFQVLFRFYPDGTAVNGLQEGEVGLFQGCGGTGKAAIFIPLLGAGKPSPPYNLTALSSPATTLDGTAKAVRIGNGSSIYWGQSATTPVAAVVQNTDCLNVSPRGNLYVEPVSTTIVTAHNLLGQSCLSCSFVGQSLNLTAGSPSANFQKWKFDGADFSHSSLSNLDFSNADMKDTKFVGATLSNVKFTGAIVDSNGLDFSGATLTNVDFSGMNITNFKFTGATLNNINLSSAVVSGNGIDFTNATLNQVNVMGREPFATVFVNATLCGVSVTGTPNNLVDLTSGNFAGVHVVLSNTCAANLSYTNLAPSATIGSQWAGLNLTGAVITGLQGKVLSTKNNPLDLTGAVLTGVSMQGAVLDYAKGLAKQNLTAINLNNASLRFANLQGAVMYGASLQDANLEGCNMNGVALIANPNANVGTANLQGAFLRDVNLSEAQLNGAGVFERELLRRDCRRNGRVHSRSEYGIHRRMRDGVARGNERNNLQRSVSVWCGLHTDDGAGRELRQFVPSGGELCWRDHLQCRWIGLGIRWSVSARHKHGGRGAREQDLAAERVRGLFADAVRERQHDQPGVECAAHDICRLLEPAGRGGVRADELRGSDGAADDELADHVPGWQSVHKRMRRGDTDQTAEPGLGEQGRYHDGCFISQIPPPIRRHRAR